MLNTLEINKISLIIDKNTLSESAGDIIYLESLLPVLDILYKLGVDSMVWEDSDTDADDVHIRLWAVGEAVDPRWSVTARIQLLLLVKISEKIRPWHELLVHLLHDIRLGDESVIYLDEHKWDVVPSINKILANNTLDAPGFFSANLESFLRKTSRKYFNSDVIPSILQNLYFQTLRAGSTSRGILEVTASPEKGHFEKGKESPAYVFLRIPTVDMIYFTNHFAHPTLAVRGYELVFLSLEVIGDNILIVNIKESTNEWNIQMEVSVSLRDNFLYPTIRELQVEGLGILKRTVFQLFKGLLIRQIENHPLPLKKLYSQAMEKLHEKWPFIEFMPGHEISFEKLEVQPEHCSMLIVFPIVFKRFSSGPESVHV